MIRFILACIAIWGLVGAPVICAGGILAHACDCGEEIACEHEEDCSSDPCGQVGISSHRSVGKQCAGKDRSADLAPVAIAGIDGVATTPDRVLDRYATPPPSDCDNLSYPSGAHPLLI